jgi:hypothetical protein
MKVNCSSVIKIIADRPHGPQDLLKCSRSVLGKKAVVEVADAATGSELVAAANAALAVDPSIVITAMVLVVNEVDMDDSKPLSALGVKDGSSVQIRYVVTI